MVVQWWGRAQWSYNGEAELNGRTMVGQGSMVVQWGGRAQWSYNGEICKVQ